MKVAEEYSWAIPQMPRQIAMVDQVPVCRVQISNGLVCVYIHIWLIIGYSVPTITKFDLRVKCSGAKLLRKSGNVCIVYIFKVFFGQQWI